MSRSASTPILTLMVVTPSAITSAASRAAASASMIPMLCAMLGAVADLAAEQLIDRHAVDLADGIVQGDVDGRLGVGIAAQDAVHACVQLLDLGDVLTGDGRQQDLLDRDRRHLRRLAIARAVIAAPGTDHLRLAPADDAVFELEAENRIAFADARGMADPVMRPADRQRDQKDLAAADFQAGHAHGGTTLRLARRRFGPVFRGPSIVKDAARVRD